VHRVRDTLQRLKIWRPEFEGRIIALPGDIAKPRLGLSEPEYAALAASVGKVRALWEVRGGCMTRVLRRSCMMTNLDRSRQCLNLKIIDLSR
jgi:hypothetical protein